MCRFIASSQAADPGAYHTPTIGYPGVAEAQVRGLDDAMLTRDMLFGMNILTLAGLLLTGFGLSLRRTAGAGLPLCMGIMGAGTALVLFGLYASGAAH